MNCIGRTNSNSNPKKAPKVFCKELICDLITNLLTEITPFNELSKLPSPPNTKNLQHEIDLFSSIVETIPLISRVGVCRTNIQKGFYKDPNLPVFCNKDSKVMTVNHVKVANQHVYNLCGYHVMHSFIKFSRMFKLSSCKATTDQERQNLGALVFDAMAAINQSSSFWQFHFKMTGFLEEFVRKYPDRFLREHYPWRHSDLQHGDYERLYNEIFFEYHPLYKEMLHSDKHTLVVSRKLQMQFGRLIDSHEVLTATQIDINEFLEDKTHEKKIFFMLVAATNHWVGFSAIVIRDEISFFYFDSQNVDYIGWDEAQIEKHAEEYKPKFKGNAATKNFKCMTYKKRIADIQIIVDWLPRLFIGDMTIFDYLFNHHFLPEYEQNIRKNLLFKLSSLQGKEHEEEVTSLVQTYFDWIAEIIKTLHRYFDCSVLMSQETIRNLLVIYFETETLLNRCLKISKRKSTGMWKRSSTKMLKKLAELSKEVLKHRRAFPNVFAAYKIVKENKNGNQDLGDDNLMVHEGDDNKNCRLL